MGLTQTVSPTIEPVTRAEAKAWARIDGNEQDAIIDDLIAAARLRVENDLGGKQLINATWALTLDRFPPSIKLPRPPLGSVTSIQYIDTAGATQTLATSVYKVITDGVFGVIVEAYGQTWPSTRDEKNAVTVTYVAGYGATAADVPESLRSAIRMLVTTADCVRGENDGASRAWITNASYLRLINTEACPEVQCA